MTQVLVVASMARTWAEGVLPGEPAVAESAARVAVRAYVSGASVSEAHREARELVAAWARHPAHRPPRRAELLRIAS